MRRMYDAAYPPKSPPPWEVCAFYIGGDTPHVWTTTEITKQKARYRLPIWVRSNPQGATQGTEEGAKAVAWAKSHGQPKGTLISLDLETAVNAPYTRAFDAEITKGGYVLWDYGSQSYVTKNPKPSGGFWGALWNGKAVLVAGDEATQFADDRMLGTDYDASVTDDKAPLWDTQSHPVPPPKHESAVAKILAYASAEVGYVQSSSGETKYGDWYAARVKDSGFKKADWCDMFVSWVAWKAGLDKYVGIDAYVPTHRNHFISEGEYHSGTHGVQAGDILIMDFLGGNEGSHIGFVEKEESDGIHTIEGNTSGGRVKRRVRTVGILGYARPKYPTSVPVGDLPPSPSPKPSDWLDKIMSTLPTVKNGDTGTHVETVQGLCNARLLHGQTLLKIDGDFGPKTEGTVKELQNHFGASVDGVVGPQTWGVLITASHA